MRKKEMPVFAYGNVIERMNQDEQFESAVYKALNRFTQGDYGDMDVQRLEFQKWRFKTQGVAYGEYLYKEAGHETYIAVFTQNDGIIHLKYYDEAEMDALWQKQNLNIANFLSQDVNFPAADNE